MRKLVVSMVLVGMVALAGCTGMSDTQQRTLSGAAIGTIGGYAVGAMTGKKVTGMAVGAAAGAVGGYLYDQSEKSHGH
jgi:osmotically inducible lipoprotein OsmB